MAYVLYTPPRHNGAAMLPDDRPPQRALGRMWGPLKVGFTQFRIDGQWYQKSVPTTFESLEADTDIDGQTLFLRGGHWHWVREELLAEMAGDGLDVGEFLPSPDGLYPSGGTYPALTAYPGA